ncbi:extracellular solute-binding protein [Cerasicoccus frondis]|uniref:extracellular solute-binding protein n=1 Tax=Cerasicoccus frondis TaxID=490090 RepID=UPI0028526EC2|nr:extracellular solute-binding protein [Cerasicoccus frondis]
MSNSDSENKGFNWNWVALGVLLIAYIFSAGRFFLFSMRNKEGEESKVVRIAHWQLEPGYREALDWAMTQYNNLPHVKEAGITVVQMPMPTRVYTQFMNVHLISGTAPDIAAAGFSSMIQGNSIARFYASMGPYVTEPNPYNGKEYTSSDLDPELREYLATAAWKDTFLDGMEGGYKQELNDYFSVPISNLGGMRLFYNITLVNEGKAFIRQALAQDPQPKWLQNCWLRTEDGHDAGYLPDNERLRKWLANEGEVPQTLGQLILLCYGVQQMAKAEGAEYLTPMSVGNYVAGDPVFRYQASFLQLFVNELEQDGKATISGLEAMDGLSRGAWSFEAEPMTAFVELAKVLTSFYPAGYLGLDREQTQRRFVSGEAAIFSSGSWDAAGVFKGAQESENPDRRFEVKITPTPMPAPDERWGDLLKYQPSEANFKGGVPLSVNKQSHNFDWSLDFLQFISSQPINEEFNRRAIWLPAAVGADTVPSMIDFEPIVEGYPGDETFSPAGARSAIRTEWMGQFKLVLTGELEYETFAQNMMAYLKRPHQGTPGYWYHDKRDARDRTRALDRNLSVEEFMQATEDNPQVAKRFRALFYQSVSDDEGVYLDIMWKRLHPGEPYPSVE